MNKDERRIFIQRLDRLLRKMKGLFAETYIRAIEELRGAIAAGAKFEWKDYVAQTAQIEKMLDVLAGKTDVIIADGINYSYQSGVKAAVGRINDKYEAIKAKYSSKRELGKAQTKAIQTVRTDVFKSNEGKNLTLSHRVWSLQDQAKDEIQIIVNNAIAEGWSVKDMRKNVLNYLNNPKLFTMYVRNKETGELELSETARKMHPGRGVYRDPLKNAERLLRTEMLSAYRKAEIEQYQNNPLVIGYEIRTSGNHTTMKMGKPVPLKDICDRLQGRYPKSFVWTGWHPNCRCILLPITVPDDQLKDFFKAQDEGKAAEWSAKHGVKFPSKMQTWFEDNTTRVYAVNADPRKALPQWIESNKKELFEDIVEKPKLTFDKKTVMSAFYPEKGTHLEKAAWLKREILQHLERTNQQNDKERLIRFFDMFDIETESGAKVVVENLSKWEKMLNSPAKKAMKKNIEQHLSIVQSFDSSQISKGMRADFNKAINNLNQSTNEIQAHTNIEWAYNIIQYSKEKDIDMSKVSTKMPFSVFKKAESYNIAKDLKVYFDTQTEYFPQVCLKKGSGGYCDFLNKIVNIDLDSQRYAYPDGIKRVIYHEYGHADYYSRDLENNKDVKEAFENIKKLYAKFNAKAFTEKIKDYIKKYNINSVSLRNESLVSYTDIVQSIDPKHRSILGVGRESGYYKTEQMKLTEFVAHLSELQYLGNNVIKELDPKMWDIMKALCKLIY